MGLGEVLDGVRRKHDAAPPHNPLGREMCDGLDRIQKAYEEMIQNLNVLDNEMSLPIGYESVLPRDPDFAKEEAA